MDLETFSGFLKRALGVQNPNAEIWHSAYKSSRAECGPMDLDQFFSWYQANMFSLIAPSMVSVHQQVINALVIDIAKEHGISPVAVEKIKTTFDGFDLNHSGEIDFGEFESMMAQLMGVTHSSELPGDRMLRFWKEVDRDGGGSIDFSEFAGWYIKYFFADGSGAAASEAFNGSSNTMSTPWTKATTMFDLRSE